MENSEPDASEWLKHAQRGDFARAWEVSDRILRRHITNPDFRRPRHLQSIWQGEPLAGKRVLIRCYHGLGDTIQFIRYAPMVRAIARELIVWAQPSLIPSLRSVPGIDRLLPLHDGSPDVPYDVDVEVMELPFVFRTTLDTIPRDVPYLESVAAPLPGSAPRVGIVWRAGEWDTGRWIPFDTLPSMFADANVTWCSLQLGRRRDETHPRLDDISHEDVTVAAARIKALDLLITADSMPAHLGGALGIPVWTVLKKDADWRWMEGRSDSPWYPTMRLFRQTREGGWGETIETMNDELRSMNFPNRS